MAIGFFGMVQFWVAASNAAWGWQNFESGATIPKSFGFEAATPYKTTNNITRNLTYLNHAAFSTAIIEAPGRLGYLYTRGRACGSCR